jgi:hypothetical protein
MSVEEAKNCYASLSKEVFTSKNHIHDGKFDARALEIVIKQVVKETTGNENESIIEHDHSYKTYVIHRIIILSSVERCDIALSVPWELQT